MAAPAGPRSKWPTHPTRPASLCRPGHCPPRPPPQPAAAVDPGTWTARPRGSARPSTPPPTAPAAHRSVARPPTGLSRQQVAATLHPGSPGRLSALRVSHRKSALYGDFVWACRALNSPKWRLPARALWASPTWARSGAPSASRSPPVSAAQPVVVDHRISAARCMATLSRSPVRRGRWTAPLVMLHAASVHPGAMWPPAVAMYSRMSCLICPLITCRRLGRNRAATPPTKAAASAPR
jgi:hypothetical protein